MGMTRAEGSGPLGARPTRDRKRRNPITNRAPAAQGHQESLPLGFGSLSETGIGCSGRTLSGAMGFSRGVQDSIGFELVVARAGLPLGNPGAHVFQVEQDLPQDPAEEILLALPEAPLHAFPEVLRGHEERLHEGGTVVAEPDADAPAVAGILLDLQDPPQLQAVDQARGGGVVEPHPAGELREGEGAGLPDQQEHPDLMGGQVQGIEEGSDRMLDGAAGGRHQHAEFRVLKAWKCFRIPHRPHLISKKHRVALPAGIFTNLPSKGWKSRSGGSDRSPRDSSPRRPSSRGAAFLSPEPRLEFRL